MGGGSDARAKNVAVYMTPNMGGFSGACAYTTDLKGWHWQRSTPTWQKTRTAPTT
jgi:hypothetical protein